MTRKNSKNKMVVFLSVMAVVFMVGIFNMDTIYNKISGIYRMILEEQQYNYRNEKKEVDLKVCKRDENIKNNSEWYMRQNIISHSGGGYEGKCYTNSLEAWKKSYEGKNRIFDADLAFTEDKILVLRHEWFDDFEQENISSENIPTYEEFMNTPIHYKYTPMSCYDMLEFMREHTDCYVACDFKGDITEQSMFLVNAAKELGCEEVLERIIISFYSYEDYDKVREVYFFQNWAIRQYENEPHNYYELAEFCLNNNVPVCMIKAKYLEAGDDISVLIDNGITVFAAVVNDLQKFEKYRQMGVKGCVSDYILEEDLIYID